MRLGTSRIQRDERGASLVLAIVFMVVAGAIGAGLTTSITSGISDNSVLAIARNREYAADGAIESAITQVRNRMTSGNAQSPCPASSSQTLNQIPIDVDCNYVPNQSLSGFLQRNAVFTAHCPAGTPPACPLPAAAVIIRAQVNFASPSPPDAASITVSKTYIQAWSVNG